MPAMLDIIRAKLRTAHINAVQRSSRLGLPRYDSFTVDELLSTLRDKKGYRCATCPVGIIKGFELDHTVPMAHGGLHIRDNVRFTCRPCNRSKQHGFHPLSVRPWPREIDHTIQRPYNGRRW